MTYSNRPFEALPREGRVGYDDAANSLAELDHARVRDLLSDYLDGTLAPADGERIDRHLDRCQACRAFRNTLHTVIDVAAQLPSPRLSDEAKRRIVDQLKAASSPS
jgi:predicted anti-sigma-YlaC factor YlaD